MNNIALPSGTSNWTNLWKTFIIVQKKRPVDIFTRRLVMRATLAQNDKRCGLCFDVMLHEREPEPLSGTYFGNLDLKCPISEGNAGTVQ